jgi:hypothetical protein
VERLLQLCHTPQSHSRIRALCRQAAASGDMMVQLSIGCSRSHMHSSSYCYRRCKMPVSQGSLSLQLAVLARHPYPVSASLRWIQRANQLDCYVLRLHSRPCSGQFLCGPLTDAGHYH